MMHASANSGSSLSSLQVHLALRQALRLLMAKKKKVKKAANGKSVAVAGVKKFCILCNKYEISGCWHGPHGSQCCHQKYQEMERNLETMPKRPSWFPLWNNLGHVDHTGSPIYGSHERHDVQAMKLCRRILLNQDEPFNSDRAVTFLSAYVSLIYWETSSACWLMAMVQYPWQQAKTAKAIMSEYENVKAIFDPCKMKNGILRCESSSGLRSVGRDKDRGFSTKRFGVLAKESAKWLQLSSKVANVLSAPGTYSVSEVLDLFQKADLKSYTGEDASYATLGLVRLLGLMYNKKFEDSKPDWSKMRRMSGAMGEKLKTMGLYEHTDAIECRNALRKVLKLSDYSLSDLIIFVCLLPKE
jgi:hypothetical protein